MITSLFYYGHYRDFLSRSGGGNKNVNPNGSIYNRQHIQQAHKVAESSILLNKNDNMRTKQFIANLTVNVVQLKDATKRLSFDAGNLGNLRSAVSYEKHLQWMDADLQRFAATYNNIGILSQDMGHSGALGNLQHSIRNIAQDNKVLLSHVGIVEMGGQGLTYHGIGNANTREIARAASEALKAGYEAARDFLIHPMATHLEFRDLGYYYNYTIGAMPQDTVRLIESGILIDRVI
ncbi:MAG: hypothetical protein FWE21_02615 [Defluviitaleaceae bacterium]|nr:hypothetical protein [Defluviitaleaceae bacterium]